MTSRSKPIDNYALISFLVEFDGRPQFVAKSTHCGKQRDDTCRAIWTDSPREAKQFRSRRAANSFIRKLEDPDGFVFCINLSNFGFAG